MSWAVTLLERPLAPLTGDCELPCDSENIRLRFFSAIIACLALPINLTNFLSPYAHFSLVLPSYNYQLQAAIVLEQKGRAIGWVCSDRAKRLVSMRLVLCLLQ